jgi:hypothetical protein
MQQSPLSINTLSSFLQDSGLSITPFVTKYLGASKTNDDYTPGSVINNTCLKLLTYAINDAYTRGQVDLTPAGSSTYDNLISIGQGSIPALGNAKSPGYTITDPSNNWSNYPSSATYKGPATTGYAIAGNTGQGQEATWIPWSTDNDNVSVTQWGFLRSWALQAWNEFNWNGLPSGTGMPEYGSFIYSFSKIKSFIDSTNQIIMSMKNSQSFLNGSFSNNNDLSSGDISGVTLSTQAFGQDCIALGKAIDLSKIDKFGLPSVLLQTLYNVNALTQTLSLALLSAGLSSQEIDDISTGNTDVISINQEQQIYGAFLIITGIDLEEILVPLNCKTKKLESLADLLDVKKIFPNSYQTLTVPVYDSVVGRSNSKIYYLLFENDSVSSGVKNYGKTSDTQAGLVTNNSNTFNFQPESLGFGSYLYQILPENQAILAGAFASSMQQIKNISSVDFQKFSQVVFSIEMADRNLNLISGVTTPINTAGISQSYTKLALGSGPYGTYVMSDFLGSMSGLPYMWGDLEKAIKNVQTTKLTNIYQELYLATTWDAATVTVQYTTDPGPIYTITGITITNSGGGYGRGSAVAPTITIAGGSGATATCAIGTDNSNIGSDGEGDFGRVLTVTLTSIGTPNGTIPTVTIECPPTATLPVSANGNVSTSGVNTVSGTSGWPGMNTVVDAYITQADTEIDSILVNNAYNANVLNTIYKIAGQQLTVEQRARFTALEPVNVPRDTNVSTYPNTTISFVDMIPEMSTNTLPHMYAQTLEAISNLNNIGGQSLIGMMRQERNAIKLQEIGIPLDNKIPNKIDDSSTKLLLSNGTVPTALFGIDVSGINGNPDNPVTTFTLPSNLLQENSVGDLISNCPMGYFDPNTETFKITESSSQVGQYPPIQEFLNLNNSANNTNLLGPNNNGTGPALQTVIPLSTGVNDGVNILQTGTTNAALGESLNNISLQPIVVVRAGPRLPSGLGTDIETDSPVVEGSLAGDEYTDLVPPTLNSAYNSSTLGCFKYTPEEAVPEVTRCNCDCW